jgi:hypothetical protein
MKLFQITWQSNFGLGCCIIAANNEKEAKTIASENPWVWKGFDCMEIIIPEKAGVIECSVN